MAAAAKRVMELSGPNRPDGWTMRGTATDDIDSISRYGDSRGLWPGGEHKSITCQEANPCR
jgi:hypothetical protein